MPLPRSGRQRQPDGDPHPRRPCGQRGARQLRAAARSPHGTGEDEEVVKAELQQLLDHAYAQANVEAEIIAWQPTTGGATQTDSSEAIVEQSLAACRRHGQSEPGPFGFQGGCDLVHFRSLGAKGVVIGPGSLSVAHKPDEFVPVDEFIAAADIYLDIALAMLPPASDL